ncbi:uncharacterized protein LOC109832185 [Asparagus officinalis]|uniref:uncharacterized protein LOC109832185 n=1 Tax=Asparagus officinalis TaxID=4686 RepID=UPI00098E4620|nr:uncharacterized protein LOC109832185 [Asparagus officinalis]
MPRPSAKKLSKLKSMLKRLQSFSGRQPSTPTESPYTDTCQSPTDLHPVYVGQSRRRYLITAQLAEHPLLQELLQRSRTGGEVTSGAVVGCEVVLFDHLLWMLENGEGENESVAELVEYYAC